MSAIQAALEWCDRNMHSNYPVLDSASCLSNSGVYLPSSFLVDCQLVIPRLAIEGAAEDAVPVNDRFFISGIARVGAAFVIEVSFWVNDETQFKCAQSAPIPLDTNNVESISARTFAVTPLSNSIPDTYRALDALTGYFIVGTCIDMQAIGTLTFGYEATPIIGLRVYMTTAGLQSITFRTTADDGTQSDITLYNDFVINAGDGIDFATSVVEADGRSMTQLTILRVPTTEERLNAFRSVDDILTELYNTLGNPIRAVNGIGPDQSGNFMLKGTDCLTIENLDHGVLASNPCGKPCCEDTAPDPSALFESELKRLQAYYESISNNVNAIQARLASLIASRG